MAGVAADAGVAAVPGADVAPGDLLRMHARMVRVPGPTREPRRGNPADSTDVVAPARNEARAGGRMEIAANEGDEDADAADPDGVVE